MQDIKDLSGLIITFLVVGGLLYFRKEIRKLVDWIVSFRRIAKTKNGYEFAGSSQPEEKEMPPLEEDPLASVEVDKKPAPEDMEGDQPKKKTWIRAFIKEEYDEAIQLLEAAIEETHEIDQRVRLKSIIGNARFIKNRDDGVSYFENLIAENKDSPHPYYWFALSHFSDEQYERAIVIIKRGLQAGVEVPNLITLHVSCLQKLGRTPEAISILTSAIKKSPQVPDYYLSLADLYVKNNDKASAKRCYREGLATIPKDVDLLSKYAFYLYEDGQNEEALLRYIKLTRLEPNEAGSLTYLGNIRLNLGLNDRAMEAYRQANELTPRKQGWILANIGNLYKNRGFYSRAVYYLKEALEVDPDYKYAHERLAQAMALQEEEKKKEESILESVEKSLLIQSGEEGSLFETGNSE
jgi:tetratricopeptide (TPR) repeat protein